MALKKQLTKQIRYYSEDIVLARAAGESDEFEKETTFNDAYIMVSSCSYNKENGVVSVKANIYSDSTKTFLIETLNFGFTPDLSEKSDNFVAQAYGELKKMGRFAGALDC